MPAKTRSNAKPDECATLFEIHKHRSTTHQGNCWPDRHGQTSVFVDSTPDQTRTHAHFFVERVSFQSCTLCMAQDCFRVKRVRVNVLCSLPSRSLTTLLNIPHCVSHKSYPHQPVQDPDLQPKHSFKTQRTPTPAAGQTRRANARARRAHPGNTVLRRKPTYRKDQDGSGQTQGGYITGAT